MIEELWPEHPPDGAAARPCRSTSRACARRSPRRGGAGVVATGDHGYALRVEPEQIDAHRFERLVPRRARSWRPGGPGRPRHRRSRRRSALWRGPPLADLADEPFAQRESARLEDVRVGALEQLVDAKLALGRHAEVVAAARGADRRAPLPRAAARAAHARAVPLRPPGRRAAGLPGRAAHGSSTSWASSRASGCASSSRRSSRRTRPSPPRRSAAGALPSGVLTFLLTDIEGSTALWEADPAAMAAALELHDDARRAHRRGARRAHAEDQGRGRLDVHRVPRAPPTPSPPRPRCRTRWRRPRGPAA